MSRYEATFGSDHPNTYTSVNNLAVLYQLGGRYSEAEPLYVRALAASERMLGKDDPSTLTTTINLADLFKAQGRYAEARTLYLRTIEALERVLGRDHPTTLSSVNSLAALYESQGRNAEAEPLYRRVFEARQRVLGAEHPDTISSVGSLGVLYEEQGRYSEAEPLFLRALEARRRVLGVEHPKTLTSVLNLAALYGSQGRYAEAEPLNLRALAGYERTLGKDHPDTLTAVNNLAVLYESQGRYSEAEPLYLHALEARQRLLGEEHEETIISVNNLAVHYKFQGRLVEAEPLMIRALAAYERTLGKDHPDTMRSVNNLAALYQSLGRLAEAEALYLRALEGHLRILGKYHPDTIRSVNNLAFFYKAVSRYADADLLYSSALRESERALGRVHPDTIGMAVNLVVTRLTSYAPASAIEPARLVVSSLRSRRAAGASGNFAEAQRGREESQDADKFSLLADAAWSAAPPHGLVRTTLTKEGFTALQDATIGNTNAAVLKMAVRHIADDRGVGLGALVREREELGLNWVVNSASYSAAIPRSDEEADALKQTLNAERDRIEARMDAIDAILRRDFPQYFSLVRPEPLELAATQAMLAPDEAILLAVPTRFGTHVMAIDRAGVEWQRSPWTQSEVDKAVGHLVGDIRATMADEKYNYDRQTAFALYGQIVAPVAARLKGKRHVFIVSAGSLSSLPFGVLVTEAPQGANDDPQALKTTPWFADAHALIQLPSIQSLQFLRKYGRALGRSDPASDGFVGFGNPTLEGPPNHPELCTRGGRGGPTAASVALGLRTRSGGMRADISLIRQLCPLPGTAAELENMRTAFGAAPASLHLAARSTERVIRTMDLSRARVIVLATHGLVAGEMTGAAEPGLVFTPPPVASDEDDGFLTASEVSAMRLDADWIILSACNTAAGDGSDGAPGLSGLARAFFYAGARNLLASHWPVADEAAARLTVRTIELMGDKPTLSRAEALQHSAREVRENPSHPAWAHPGVWAPFSLIGDGAQ